MKERIFRLLAIAFVMLFASSHALAQDVSARYVESVDVQVLNAINALRSKSVTVGKLVTVMSMPKSGRAIAVLDVEETLMGDPQKTQQISLPGYGDSREIRRIYAENKGARLLFIGGSFYVLNDKSPVFRVLGGETISCADNVLPYIREVIRSHPNWKSSQIVRIDGLIVPIDARSEKLAIEAVENESAIKRHEAVDVLQHFKSDQNIALMKRLLKDPVGYIRESASRTLKEWGVAEN